jgi:hypothetical protein
MRPRRRRTLGTWIRGAFLFGILPLMAWSMILPNWIWPEDS